MSPRRRNPINQPLPDFMRVRKGYYSWTNPLDGREKGLGRDRAHAIAWARAANAEVHRLRSQQSAAEWVRGVDAKTWGAWLDRYEQLLARRPLSDATRYTYADLMRKARAAFPSDRSFASIDVEGLATVTQKFVDAGKVATGYAVRAWLVDCFREAIAEGWRTDNPAMATRRVQRVVRRARLELEQAKRIYDGITQPWLRNAVALALVSGQRREDVVRAQRRDIRDGHWWVQQGKTGARIAIPLSLRLNAFGLSLQDVIDQCRTNVLSPYLIHQTRDLARSQRGAAPHVGTVSRGFQRAVARLGIDWAGKKPPSFHELRSLSKRLYMAQGGVDTKQLLGHKSTASADKYEDARGQWVKLSVK